MLHTFKFMLAALTIIIIASTTYAFAATNAVLPNQAGEGAGTISGYEVTNIAYHSNADPAKIDSVTFTLNATAKTVNIKLVETGSTWYDCTVIIGNDWSCDTPGAIIATADKLRVLAVSN